MKTWVKTTVILLALILCSVSLVFSFSIRSGMSQNDVLGDDSYIIDFDKIEGQYFQGFEVPVDIVFKTFDYSDEFNQDAMLKTISEVEDSGLVRAPIGFWLKEYLLWLPNSPHNTSLTTSGRPPNSKLFYGWLYEYFAMSPTGALGYAKDIVLRDGLIKTTRVRTQHLQLNTDFDRADAMQQLYKITALSKVPTFAYSFHYVYWEQYVHMMGSNIKNLTLVGVSIFLIVLVFLGDVKSSLVVITALVMVDIDLLGVMWLWDISLSNVSLVNLLLSLGLAVDACAHVTHSVKEAAKISGNTREAVITGLATIGSSILSGTLTSFLGILPLGIANHEILRMFFKFFFSIFLLALFHGLALVPVVLSLINK